MNKISDAFRCGKAFIPFVTCGDPSLEVTEEVVLALAENGADLIELGIPFSDPTAEGPVIAQASLRALQAGTTTDRIFEMVRRLRTQTQVPLVFMTYANVVFSYGPEAFLQACEELGVDGLILPDVPFEEQEEFLKVCQRHGVSLISMVAPTSQERTGQIAAQAEGFIYLVSSLGVTGARSALADNLTDVIRSLREETDVPVAIGFGIHTPEQAAEMAGLADGVIVGSAMVQRIHENPGREAQAAADYARLMKQAAAGCPSERMQTEKQTGCAGLSAGC